MIARYGLHSSAWRSESPIAPTVETDDLQRCAAPKAVDQPTVTFAETSSFVTLNFDRTCWC